MHLALVRERQRSSWPLLSVAYTLQCQQPQYSTDLRQLLSVCESSHMCAPVCLCVCVCEFASVQQLWPSTRENAPQCLSLFDRTVSVCLYTQCGQYLVVVAVAVMITTAIKHRCYYCSCNCSRLLIDVYLPPST